MPLNDFGPTFLHRPEGEDGPVYELRQPRGFDVPRYRAAIKIAGGRRTDLFGIAAHLSESIKRLLPDEPERRGTYLAHVEAWRAQLSDAFDRSNKGEFQDAEGNFTGEFLTAIAMPAECRIVHDLCERFDPVYAAVGADNEQYTDIAAIVAVQMFVLGWQGNDLPPYSRGLDGVPLDLVDHLPPAHRWSIGRAIAEKIELPRSARKNSASPPGGGGTPTTSRTTRTRPRKPR